MYYAREGHGVQATRPAPARARVKGQDQIRSCHII